MSAILGDGQLGDFQFGDFFTSQTITATPMSGSWVLVSFSPQQSIIASPTSGSWRVITPELGFSIALTPISGNWQLVSQKLGFLLSATPVSGSWRAVFGTLAPSGTAPIRETPITAPWTVHAVPSPPPIISPLSAHWVMSAGSLRARQNFIVVDGSFSSSTNTYSIGAVPGFDPTQGIYWRTNPGSSWQFLAVSGTTFILPVTGSVYIRYSYRTNLVNRGDIGVGAWSLLPQWMGQSPPPIFKGVSRPIAYQGELITQRYNHSNLQHWIQLTPVNDTRLIWVAPIPNIKHQDLLVTFLGNDGNGGVCRSARSGFDFDTAIDPIWSVDVNTGRVLLKNLMTVEEVLFSFTHTYVVYGEYSGLVPDWGIYWRANSSLPWNWLDPESVEYNVPINPALSGFAFNLPITGTASIRYASQSRLDALDGQVIVHWAGGQTRGFNLVLTTPDNIFDAFGSLLGLPRLTGEDNLHYKNRLKLLVVDPPDSTLSGIIRGISSRLGLVESVYWDGISTLNLDPSGTRKITQVSVVGVQKIREIVEKLTPDLQDATRYWASVGGWLPGSFVTEDGRPVQVVSINNNQVILGRPSSGSVDAVYSVNQYVLSYNTSGYITSISSGTGLISGSYTLVLSEQVNVFVPDLAETQKELLLTPAGLPNKLFLDIAGELTRENTTIFGESRWGSAFWSIQSENLPTMSSLPFSSDVSSIVECSGVNGPYILDPRTLPGMELYLDSRLGLSGAQGSNVSIWPDQSGNSRDASNQGSVHPTLQTTQNTSPNGSPTVFFTGLDFPTSCWLSWAPTGSYDLPQVSGGYTFYVLMNGLSAVSSSSDQVILDGASNGNAFRLQIGSVYGFRDEITDHDTTTAYTTGAQFLRWIRHSLGTNQGSGTIIKDTIPLGLPSGSWQTTNRSDWQGYSVGQLAANNVTGLHAYVMAILWFSREHDPATQLGVENWLRWGFGFPLLT